MPYHHSFFPFLPFPFQPQHRCTAYSFLRVGTGPGASLSVPREYWVSVTWIKPSLQERGHEDQYRMCSCPLSSFRINGVTLASGNVSAVEASRSQMLLSPSLYATQKYWKELGGVAYTFNPSARESEAGGSV